MLNKNNKLVYSSILIILFLSIVCSCQTQSPEKKVNEKTPSTPPGKPANDDQNEAPSAAIFSAPKKEEIKEFISEEYGFKADFAGLPEKLQSDGGSSSVVFVRPRRGGFSMVGVSEDTNDILKDLKVLDQKIQEKINEEYNAKILEVKDFTLEGVAGKEYSATFGLALTYMKVRYIRVGKRFYEIRNVAQNWHMLDQKQKEEFEAEANRFFKSFQILKKI